MLVRRADPGLTSLLNKALKLWCSVHTEFHDDAPLRTWRSFSLGLFSLIEGFVNVAGLWREGDGLSQSSLLISLFCLDVGLLRLAYFEPVFYLDFVVMSTIV